MEKKRLTTVDFLWKKKGGNFCGKKRLTTDDFLWKKEEVFCGKRRKFSVEKDVAGRFSVEKGGILTTKKGATRLRAAPFY